MWFSKNSYVFSIPGYHESFPSCRALTLPIETTRLFFFEIVAISHCAAEFILIGSIARVGVGELIDSFTQLLPNCLHVLKHDGVDGYLKWDSFYSFSTG